MNSYVYCIIIYNSQDMETNWLSINGWKDKEDVIYIDAMEYYSAMKKDILLFATTWMDLKDIMLSEISQTEKDK